MGMFKDSFEKVLLMDGCIKFGRVRPVRDRMCKNIMKRIKTDSLDKANQVKRKAYAPAQNSQSINN